MTKKSLAYKQAKNIVGEWKKLGMTIEKDEEYIISDIQLNLIAIHLKTVKTFTNSEGELLPELTPLEKELLEALEYISGCPQLAEVSDGEFLSEIREKARQAIARVKGEG